MKTRTVSEFKDTEIGKIPVDWNLHKIIDIAEVVGGGTPSTKDSTLWDGDIVWITPKDLSNHHSRLIFKGEKNISKKGLEKSSAKIIPKNSILLSTRAPIGYLVISGIELTTNQGFRSLIPNKKSDFNFLFYLLKNNIQKLKDHANGSTFQELPGGILKNIMFAFPSYSEQLEISRILMSLDSKIENLQKQNKVLEQIAQAIFKSWFVDFDGVTEFEDSELGQIPKGWKVDKLENYLEITKGVSYKSSELIPSNKALVTLKSIKRHGGYTERGLKPYDGKYREEQIVFENDLIIAQTDLTQDASVIGKPALIRSSKQFDILVASLDLSILRPKCSELKYYFYYMFMTDEFQNHVYGYTNGTGVLHLSKYGVPSYQFVIPPKVTLEKFTKLVSLLIQKTHDNHYQIESLTKTRDILLPKLMSGEIRI